MKVKIITKIILIILDYNLISLIIWWYHEHKLFVVLISIIIYDSLKKLFFLMNLIFWNRERKIVLILGCGNLDMMFCMNKFSPLINENTSEKKSFLKNVSMPINSVCSARNLILYIIGSFSLCHKACFFLDIAEHKLVSFDKVKAIREYVMEIRNIAAQLSNIKIFISNTFLIQFILTLFYQSKISLRSPIVYTIRIRQFMNYWPTMCK